MCSLLCHGFKCVASLLLFGLLKSLLSKYFIVDHVSDPYVIVGRMQIVIANKPICFYTLPITADLTIFPAVGSMFGGEEVFLVGPCWSSDVQIKCQFKYNGDIIQTVTGKRISTEVSISAMSSNRTTIRNKSHEAALLYNVNRM